MTTKGQQYIILKYLYHFRLIQIKEDKIDEEMLIRLIFLYVLSKSLRKLR